MMDPDLQLKVQAFLDGELSADEAGPVQDILARDPEAQALLAELKLTSGALVSFVEDVKLPESREFFWSKVEREIRRHSRTSPGPAWLLKWASWRHWLRPALTFAALALVGLVAFRGHRGPLALVEATLADAGAFTYHDYSARTTLVWFSYPADNEIAGADLPGSFK